MKNIKDRIQDFLERPEERPEIQEVRNRILMKLKWPVLTLGLLAAVLGSVQAYMQGRSLFTIVYLCIYCAVFIVFFWDRSISFSIRACVLVAGLYIFSVAVLIRIGMSGIGLEIMILSCLLSAVFWGVRSSLVIIGLSIFVIAGVAFGMVSGLLAVHGKDMMTSLSPMAWATAGLFFLLMTVGFVFIPQMFLHRLKESLSLLEDKTHHLEESNITLRHEIEAREKAEKAVKEAQTIINRSPAVTFLWKNAEGWPVEFVSNNVKRLLGFEQEELMSGKFLFRRIVHPDDLGMMTEGLASLIEKEGMEECRRDPYRIITKDGEVKWIDEMTFVRKNEKGDITHFEGIVLDITERMKAEEEKEKLQVKLQRSKTMESLGLLAGGVAHDLNNVLSGIVSYPELLLMDLPDDSKLKKPIERIQESGQRAAAIVQDLLTIARGVAISKEPMNINDVVNDYLHSPEFIKLKQFHPGVTFTTRLDSNLMNIYGSDVHIRKVVMNLISNASEAIEGIGQVTISTENRYVDKPLKGYGDVIEGEYAVLSISDNGSGISSADLDRIFEPFYTNKTMGRSGTGLGLTLVWNVIRDHEGYIDVKSDQKGTTFEVYTPIRRIDILDKVRAIPIKDYKGNGEKILVVDDVESQREIVCNMLDKLGYSTISVSSGEEAVEYLKENRADLIVLDMIMEPGVNGRETYERIVEIHENQKAVIVSGFAETDEVKAAQKSGAGQYIKKPFTLQRIGLAVKEELEK